jgi:hypothetical protein
MVGAHRVGIAKAMKSLKAGRILQEGRTLILAALPADYSV